MARVRLVLPQLDFTTRIDLVSSDSGAVDCQNSLEVRAHFGKSCIEIFGPEMGQYHSYIREAS
jgi:hypothetical protein